MTISRDDQFALDELTIEKRLSEVELDSLKQKIDRPVLSIHWEIKTLLSVGFGLFTVGIGRLIYDYMDSYIRWIILSILIIGFVVSSLYCFTWKEAFSWQKVTQKKAFFEVVLVLCTSMFLSLEGYLQYEFKFFGEGYSGMAIIPTVFYFFCAYYFDNLVVLTKGMIAFTAWFAISFKVFNWENSDIFSQEIPAFESILIGLAFLIIGYVMNWQKLKKHFKNAYLVFAVQLIMLALTAKFVNEQQPDPIFLVLIMAFSLGFYGLSVIEKDHIILFTVIVYFYIALTAYLGVFDWEEQAIGLYFLGTGLLTIGYFIYKRKAYAND